MCNNKSIRPGANLLPVFFTAGLVLLSIIGVARLYSLGAAALASATVPERLAMSRCVDYASTDYASNLRTDPGSIFGSISTLDGRLLYDATHSRQTPAFAGLIGSMQFEDTRYVSDRYQKQLFSAHYTPFRGFVADKQADLVLTLNASVHEDLFSFLTEHNVKGSVFAYNYDSGDICCMVSTPGAALDDGNAEAGSWLNKCLYNTTPGSTMKLVLCYLLEMQGVRPEELIFHCEGRYHLKHAGECVNCTGTHGAIDGVTALGVSCNCYFAQAAELLGPEQVKADLEALGFQVNQTKGAQLGSLPRSSSVVQLSGVWDFNSVFGLIGQNETLVSPIDMATLAGQYATGGTAAAPRLVVGECPESKALAQEQIQAFADGGDLWRRASELHRPKGFSELITAAKTGTCDELGKDGNRTQKLLCGYSEQLHTAFYIVVENHRAEGTTLDVTAAEIANRLLTSIQSAG